MPRFNMNWLYITVAIVLAILLFSGGGNSIAKGTGATQEASYSDFKGYVDKGYALCGHQQDGKHAADVCQAQIHKQGV